MPNESKNKNNNEARAKAQANNEKSGPQLKVEIEGKKSTVTINATTDPKYPSDSEYVSIKDATTGEKTDATMVVDSSGNILNENKNSSWYEPTDK